MSDYAGRIIIYGGKGALGNAAVKFFRSKNWWVGSIDLHANEEANSNLVIKPSESWIEQNEEVQNGVTKMLDGFKLDALICVAGGWAGGNAKSKDLIKNADAMWKQSAWTSLISASISSAHLKEGGLLTLTGAKAALEGTSGCMGYGMAKAAVHQLVNSLSSKGSGLPTNSKVIAILPVCLDTPMNRKFMPSADFLTWTPLEFVAELFHGWASNVKDAPSNGSLMQLTTEAGVTQVVAA